MSVCTLVTIEILENSGTNFLVCDEGDFSFLFWLNRNFDFVSKTDGLIEKKNMTQMTVYLILSQCIQTS